MQGMRVRRAKPRGPASRLDWDDLRHVAAVARHGSLLAASEALGVDHTTVARRIAAAERALGAVLFVRSPLGLTLTAAGEALSQPVEAVESAILAVERHAGATQSSAKLSGRVKVTAPETLGCCVVAPSLARFAVDQPELTIDVDASGAVRNLHRREAEIAVRTQRPREPDLVAKRAGRVAYAAYASRAFLARRPVRGARDLPHVPLGVGAASDADTRWLLALAGGVQPRFRCELAVGLQLALRTGLGVGVLPRYLGDVDAALARIPLPDEPSDDVFLIVHEDMRSAPAVRAVWTTLLETLGAL